MKKTLSTILALVMLLSMAIPMFASAEEAYAPTTWESFAEKVTITVPVYDRAKAGYPPVDNNYWTQWIQKEFGDKYNIDVQYVAIPRGDVMTTYNLLIADKKTPTIMMEYDYPKVAEWAATGAMRTIDLEAFKAIAPNYYQSMIDNNQLGYTDIGGETFFVLSERPYYQTEFTFVNFVRLDWLEAVGKTLPTTYAEHIEAMDAIIAAGLTDKAPLGLTIPAAANSGSHGFRKVPLNEKEWAIHSSLGTTDFTWYPTQERMRRLNAEYNKGWYSEEFDLGAADLGGNATDMQADFINGKLYQYGAYIAANMDWLKSFYEVNPDAKLAVASALAGIDPETSPELVIRAGNPFGMIVGFSALASEDEVKAAWMLMEWMHNPEVLFVLENGVEGVTYEMGADGQPVVYGDYMGEEMLNHNMNIDMTCLVHASKIMGTPEETIKVMAPQGLPQDFTDEIIANYYDLQAAADAGRAISDPMFSVIIESEAEYSATLLSLYKEYFVKLVKCDPAEFDGLYAQFAQEFLDAGYQEIIDERGVAYDAGQTTTLPENSK